ncbi:RHS repeat-associated core domain-containing protein [Paenibacillus urinalis]|uniref:RHS repeat-associated core domain-containing protein n=1 Tax=Paenibacillus urinalis TaxID=521520 RepID=A0AAX3MUL0_9BACL|nr:RHS repeat-associated core domain-containing protein [Paenibacillus urinalis]WDH80479.1 RHS repeat-associated core domain-containing protein [Paenibacillus urinalis]WDH96520.1 RHS repeat-associated core domain-containing protein [Paenibacillus urinalis]WDI00165.1 RHS repeat-associated core domain-containing protein [Paenibacillus urinalis]
MQSEQVPEDTNSNYVYDNWDRLTEVTTTDQTKVTYQYNGDDLMIERTEHGNTSRYYYDQYGNIIAEGSVQTDGSIKKVASYVRNGNQLNYRVDGQGEKQYYVLNGHGDVEYIVDSTGEILNSYTYDLWGKPISKTEKVTNPFLYAGEYWDPSTNLQYLRARWYDPNIGRFINEDTYEGDINSPQTLNLYAYVQNNPLKYTDPSGHMAKNLLNGFLKDFLGGRNDGTQYTNLELSDAVLNANGDDRIYLALHEIAQIHAAKAIHLETGLNTTLEFHVEKEIKWWPNKHYWVDIVTGDGQMWEVKARRDVLHGDTDGYYEDAEEQLTKYQDANNDLTRGVQHKAIIGIIVEGDLYMDIEFINKGKIFYEFYLDDGKGIRSMTTIQAKNYVEANHLYPPDFDFKPKKKGGK